MVYQSPSPVGVAGQAVTDPSHARYFRITMSGSYQNGMWVGEQAVMGLNFVFGESMPSELVARYECPNVLIERVTDNSPSVDGRVAGVSRVWQTGNAGRLGIRDVWIHKDECDSIATKAIDFLVGLAPQIDTHFYWEKIKVYPLNTNHETINGPNTYTLKSSVKGGGSANAHPPQLAASLTTGTYATQKGASGRMYVPIHHLSLTSEGTIGTTQATDMATRLATFVNGLYRIDVLSGLGDPDTAERIRPAVIHKNSLTFSDISVIGCGDRVDTIRRRRNKGEETYTWQPLDHT